MISVIMNIHRIILGFAFTLLFISALASTTFSQTRGILFKNASIIDGSGKAAFRGDVRIKDDRSITEQDIAQHNLVLWGDPSSNQLLAELADKLPIRWGHTGIKVGESSFSVEHHVLALICPNPRNPSKYLVLNSGFTFREYDYLNNARQVPKLPDYAVVNILAPATPRLPGEVVTAGFFDERWALSRISFKPN